jgi:hypothetical protein
MITLIPASAFTKGHLIVIIIIIIILHHAVVATQNEKKKQTHSTETGTNILQCLQQQNTLAREVTISVANSLPFADAKNCTPVLQ